MTRGTSYIVPDWSESCKNSYRRRRYTGTIRWRKRTYDQIRCGPLRSRYGRRRFTVDPQLISFLPQNNLEETPLIECKDPIDRLDDNLNDIIPDNPNQAYDMYEVIGTIIDNGEFLEVHADYAKNIIVGFARFNGQTVGIVANQPKVMAGCLDSNASRKAGRFVRFCDAFNIPLVTLVDVPGFLPGTGRNTTVLSCTEPNCFTLTAKPQCLK